MNFILFNTLWCDALEHENRKANRHRKYTIDITMTIRTLVALTKQTTNLIQLKVNLHFL
jgi:hypothetical protein